MAQYILDGTGNPIDVGGGISVSAANTVGHLLASEGSLPRARDLGVGGTARPDLDSILEEAGVVREKTLTLSVSDTPGARGVQPDVPRTVVIESSRDVDSTPVVLLEDESGALHWLVPDDASAPGRARALPGADRARFTFIIGADASALGGRGFSPFGAIKKIGGKIVKAVVYKIVDKTLGALGDKFATKWEEKNRPYLVRMYGPANYQTDSAPAVQLPEWQRLATGRALLFVHGTFSTCGAFSAISQDVMEELARQYGGRTFAFNHFTLTHDPERNAVELLRQIPAGINLDVDIVCHSRGGLVSRAIGALGTSTAATGGTLRVGKIVFVAAPNAGTPLADPEHILGLIDRYTNLAQLAFPGAAAVLGTITTVVKVLAHGLSSQLEGLLSMDPDGEFLKKLAKTSAGGAELFAVAADYEPPPGTPLFSLTRLKDAGIDLVFSDKPNDLVVPRDGAYIVSGAAGFPIAEAKRRIFATTDGVTHTEFFKHSRTQAWLLELLGAPAQPVRALELPPAAAPSRDQLARLLDAYRDAVLDAVAPGGHRAITQQRSLSPAETEALRPHVINLSEGQFRKSGRFLSTRTDVDAIFGDHIPKWAKSRPAGAKLDIVFFAHGGLVDEKSGLEIARKHVDWWLSNGVYPVYFVWETGLFDAIRSILESVARNIPGFGRRDLADFTTDPLVAAGCRALGGVHVWGAMKRNAELASMEGGGAHYTAQKLSQFCAAPPGTVRLHAIGHSAGSIFHAHWLPVVQGHGVSFESLQLLAPAIRVDEFKGRLGPMLGHGVNGLTIYTMRDSFERDDNCISVYRKSLLYLIHHALEPEKETPILGLERSIDSDGQLRQLLGQTDRDIVWSVTSDSSGRSASRSTSHGGFDDDPATMGSVAARVLGRQSAPIAYTGVGKSREWPTSTDWLATSDLVAAGPVFSFAPASGDALRPDRVPEPSRPDSRPAAMPAGSAGIRPNATTPRPGWRRALCVGIDTYPSPNELKGCVSDANNWASLLGSRQFGFDVQLCVNGQATRSEIIRRLGEMIDGSAPGDVLVFQYAGHGTQVPDLDGDEDADMNDEALVPIDFEQGQLLIDDDIREILSRLPNGVSLTCFMDCCHSESNTRMLGFRGTDADRNSRKRFMTLSDEIVRAYENVRASDNGARSRAFVDRSTLRWVTFSACEASEVAFETSGSGDFTRLAIPILEAGVAGVKNREFQRRVVQAFGDGRRQTPKLDCALAAEEIDLLGGVGPLPAEGSDRRSGDDRRSPGSPTSEMLGRRSGDRRFDRIAADLRRHALELENIE